MLYYIYNIIYIYINRLCVLICVLTLAFCECFGLPPGSGDLPKSFYQVAIDCPGYARSPGDKQSIRSYPGALISNIVRALGRKTVACVVGSSSLP